MANTKIRLIIFFAPKDREALYSEQKQETLRLGKIKGRRRGQQKMKWLNSIINLTDMNLSKFQKIVEDRGA